MHHPHRAACAALLLVALSGCASASLPTPTPRETIRACVIECPGAMRARDPDTGESDNGFIFRAQHMCRGGGRRWFRDVWIIGEILTNWLVCDGPPAPPLFKCTQGFEWSKQDTVIGACTNFIAGEIRARAAERRGQRPGEDAQGRPAGNQ